MLSAGYQCILYLSTVQYKLTVDSTLTTPTHSFVLASICGVDMETGFGYVLFNSPQIFEESPILTPAM